MTDRYAVVGNPVAHSLSPEIHAAFARQTGQDLEYARLPAPLDGFAATVDQFRASGGRGVNVTVPFKFDAFKYCEPAASALAAEAANTLDFRAGKIRGYNTDGSGLITDLEHNLGFAIHGQRVLVMGAGGATYGVMHPLLDARPKLLVVANRTIERRPRSSSARGKNLPVTIWPPSRTTPWPARNSISSSMQRRPVCAMKCRRCRRPCLRPARLGTTWFTRGRRRS